MIFEHGCDEKWHKLNDLEKTSWHVTPITVTNMCHHVIEKDKQHDIQPNGAYFTSLRS